MQFKPTVNVDNVAPEKTAPSCVVCHTPIFGQPRPVSAGQRVDDTCGSLYCVESTSRPKPKRVPWLSRAGVDRGLWGLDFFHSWCWSRFTAEGRHYMRHRR